MTQPKKKEPTPKEKQAIVDTMNRAYSKQVPLEALEVAIAKGFTSWASLRKEAAELTAQMEGR